MLNELKSSFLRSLKPTLKVSLLMLKVFIPLSFATLILRQFGVLDMLAPVFAPLMSLMGLPGEAAITLLVGFTNTIYGALATAAAMDLTARQITILGVILGISHSLFVETGILTSLRMSTAKIGLFRMVVGLAAGVVLNLIMPEFGGAAPHPDATEGTFTWMGALLQIGVTSLQIVIIIFSITFAYELFSLWKGSGKSGSRSSVVLRGIGISEKAVAPWMVGVLVGITYGAALFYQFNEKQGLSHKDACLVTVFLCLAHAMIEDTLLFVIVGGDFFWIFLSRMVIAILAVRLLATADIYRKFLWIGLPKERSKV
jgi:spore maturation protein SpmB